jgi:hypothetical protein
MKGRRVVNKSTAFHHEFSGELEAFDPSQTTWCNPDARTDITLSQQVNV